MIKTQGISQRTFNIFLLVILCLGMFLVLAPLLYMLGTSLKGEVYFLETPPRFIPEQPTLDNFRQAFESRNFIQAFMNSMGVALATSFFTVLLSSLMAYAFARFEFRGKSLLYALLLFTLMIPALLFIIPQFLLAKSLGLRNSLPGLVFAYTAGGMAFNCFLLRGFIAGLPRELEESALIDGANHFTIYWRILMPLCAPALATVAIFSFLGAWDEYFYALNVITDESLRTLPIAIANFRGTRASNWGLVFAGSLIQVVPTLLLFVFFQRFFVQGLTQGAVNK
jgi:ABC-type glycerol-3-phosphate transport system permease component